MQPSFDPTMQNTSLPLLPQRGAPARPHPLADLPPAAAGAGAASLYMHVPFCFHKCHYCDFYSIVDTQDRQHSFVTRLESELSAMAEFARRPLETIFVGGGTPSLLSVPLWERLLARMGELFDLSRITSGHGEFTVECNPETVTDALMVTLRNGDVNRVSIGAQSFSRAHLGTLERWHEPANVGRALDAARRAGIGRASVDLIFGVPGQTLDEWLADIDTALALGTEHVSCYALTYEPRTALTARLRRGDVQRIDEDLEADMFLATVDRMRGAGLDRYEVSNFARPGAECRHNLAYWRQHDWLAAGPSGAAHVAGHRWRNVARLDDYLSSGPGLGPFADHETPDVARSLRERIMTGLRLREGLDARTLAAEAERLEPGLGERLAAVAAAHSSGGRLVEREGRWSLTDDGMLVADAIAVDFFGAFRA